MDGIAQDEEGYLIGSIAWEQKHLRQALERIATAQEALLAIAQEARKERTALSDQMKKAFQQPLQEK